MEIDAKTRKKRPSSELMGDFRSEFQYAVAVMRYWNTNQFDGRFKTTQTQKAEDLLRERGIDPSGIGKTTKVTDVAKTKTDTQDTNQMQYSI